MYRLLSTRTLKIVSPCNAAKHFTERVCGALVRTDIGRHYSTVPEKDSPIVEQKLLLKYFQMVARDLKQVEEELEKCSHDSQRTRELTAKMTRLSSIVALVKKINELNREMEGLRDLERDFTRTGDKDMVSMAVDDQKNCQAELKQLNDQILDQIVPPDPIDTTEVLLEVTAGIGGQEAMLFTKDVLDMYVRYASWKGWHCRIVDYETSDMGGVRHASLNVGGRDAGKCLKFESGVHRVQRVPQTERAGRIHTSTMAVAVLPLPAEVDVVLNSKDLVMKTKRASGPGGQHVNTTESAVQIQHIPSGIMVESSQERSQLQNKELALKKLRAKLYEIELNKKTSSHVAQRKLQVGTRGRSEKIRTYNFAQDRVTDHRIPVTVHNVEDFLHGQDNLDGVIRQLLDESRKEILLEVLQGVK